MFQQAADTAAHGSDAGGGEDRLRVNKGRTRGSGTRPGVPRGLGPEPGDQEVDQSSHRPTQVPIVGVHGVQVHGPGFVAVENRDELPARQLVPRDEGGKVRQPQARDGGVSSRVSAVDYEAAPNGMRRLALRATQPPLGRLVGVDDALVVLELFGGPRRLMATQILGRGADDVPAWSEPTRDQRRVFESTDSNRHVDALAHKVDVMIAELKLNLHLGVLLDECRQQSPEVLLCERHARRDAQSPPHL